MLGLRGKAGDQNSAGDRTGTQHDASLVRRVASGEARAFEELYRIYHPRLTRFLINILRRPHLVEEAVDDAMMVVWRRPDSFTGASKVSTWIFAIAYRTALKALSRLDEPQEDIAAEQRPSRNHDPERRLGDRQVQKILLEAMDKLSSDHRVVVDLTYYHEAGYREIAQIMNCPVGTGKTRMFHPRQKLKDLLDGQIEDWI